MKLPFPLGGTERSVYLAVLLLLIMGIAQSLIYEDWEWFGRAGLLVIVTGTLLIRQDLISLVGNIKEFYQSTFIQLIAKMNTSKPQGLIAGAIHEGKTEEIIAAKSDVDELIEMLRKRLRTTEAMILIIGTVVSGYGAVFGRFIWKF